MSGNGKKSEGGGSKNVLWYVIGGVAIVCAVGGAVWLLTGKKTSSGSGDSKSVRATSTKRAEEAGEDSGEPASGSGAQAQRPSAAAAAAAAADGDGGEDDGEEEDAGSEEDEVEGGGGGKVDKALLLRLLRDLQESISAKAEELQRMMEDGVLEESEFEENLVAAIPTLEEELHAKYGVSQDDILVAQSEYQSDKDVIEASRELRNAALPPSARDAFAALEEVVSGEGKVPEGMTAERLAGLVRTNADITIRKMNEIAEEVVGSGAEGEEAMRKFQQHFLTRARELTMSTFSELGISAEDFAASMEKFGSDEKVMQAQQMVHMMLAMQQQMIHLRFAKEDAMQDMAAQMAAAQMAAGGGGMDMDAMGGAGGGGGF